MALQTQRNVCQAQLQRCQDQIHDLIINRHVSCVNDPGKGNIDMSIGKNTTPDEDEFYEYPYYIARIQRRFITTKRRLFRAQYLHHKLRLEELNSSEKVILCNGDTAAIYKLFRHFSRM